MWLSIIRKLFAYFELYFKNKLIDNTNKYFIRNLCFARDNHNFFHLTANETKLIIEYLCIKIIIIIITITYFLLLSRQ